jgi:hypothetical protein
MIRVLAVQREATGGIQAPVLTHLTWSALMLRFLPPLLEPPGQTAQPESGVRRSRPVVVVQRCAERGQHGIQVRVPTGR